MMDAAEKQGRLPSEPAKGADNDSGNNQGGFGDHYQKTQE